MQVTVCGKNFKVLIWNGEKLNGVIALDTETELVDHWHNTPDLVTFQAADNNAAFYVRRCDIKRFFSVQEESRPTYILHNATFDIDVICKYLNERHYFVDIIEQDRMVDTMMLYKLVHLAEVGYIPFKTNLAHLCEQYLGEILDKAGEARTTFGQYIDSDVSEIPREHLEYGAKDVVVLPYLYENLRLRAFKSGSETLLSQQIQLMGKYALNRIYKRGIGFNTRAASAFLQEKDFELATARKIMSDYGYVPGQKGNQLAYNWVVGEYLGLKLPKTDSGLSMAAEHLLPYANQPFVKAYLDYSDLTKMTQFVRPYINENVLHPDYSPIVNTGRTSCRKPNFQNQPRQGGIREMFVPRRLNSTFIITDYSTLELCTLSQICLNRFGHSTMADKINEGEDLHKYYAGVLFNKQPNQITKSERQYAKASNFGFPGGLGTATFIDYAAKTYGVSVTQDEAQEMKDAWFKAFPEMVEYMKDPDGFAYTPTGRIRGNTSFCAEKNTPFQGLAADGAKLALWACEKADLEVDGFVHDEIVTECFKPDVENTIKIQEQLMVDSMKIVCPDVKISVETTVSEHYTK